MTTTVETMSWDVFNNPDKHTQIRAEVAAVKAAVRARKSDVNMRQVRPLVFYEDGRRGDIVAEVVRTSYGPVVVTSASEQAFEITDGWAQARPYDRPTPGHEIQPLTGDRKQTFEAVTRRRSIPLQGWMFLDALAKGRRKMTVARPSD